MAERRGRGKSNIGAAMSSHYFGPPMTLNDMRAIGVRAIAASCYCRATNEMRVRRQSG